MGTTQVGVVYSAAQQIIRRVIVPDSDSQLAAFQQLMMPGEAWNTIPLASYNKLTSPQAIHDFLGLTGQPGVTDRCVVVNSAGLVTLSCCADPGIDAPNGVMLNTDHATVGNFLVQHATASVGGTLVNGVYTPPAVAVITLTEQKMMPDYVAAPVSTGNPVVTGGV